MKKWIKAVALSLAVILAIPVTVPQCDQTVVQAATKKPKLNVKNNKKTLYVGDKFKIKVTNYKDKFKWSSSNKKVATVDKNGVIKAKKAGVATISTTKDQYWVYCTVVVKNKPTDKPVNNIPKFDAEEAKSKITFTPVETCVDLYEITSTYDIPTQIVIDYKIIDKERVTINKASTSAFVTAWDKSYISIPSNTANQTIQTSYRYIECPSYNKLDKEAFEIAKNSIQIEKFEEDNIHEMKDPIPARYENINLYIKNTSDKTIDASMDILLYNEKGEIFQFIKGRCGVNGIEPNEIIKNSFSFNQINNVQNIGNIKFVITSCNIKYS